MFRNATTEYRSVNWTTVNCPRGGDKKQSPLGVWVRLGVGHEIDKCIINSQRNDQTSYSIPALQVDGRAIDDDLSKAESFNDYFGSVFTQEDNSPLPCLPVTDYPSIDPIEVSTEGVFSLLQSLDPCKACGPDNILT